MQLTMAGKSSSQSVGSTPVLPSMMLLRLQKPWQPRETLAAEQQREKSCSMGLAVE